VALALGYAFDMLSGSRFAAASLDVAGIRYDAVQMRRLEAGLRKPTQP
jgi:hypothetical protein